MRETTGGSISIERGVRFSYRAGVGYLYGSAGPTFTLLLHRSLTYSALDAVLPLRTEAVLVSASVISICGVPRHLESLCPLDRRSSRRLI